ncbi:caspase-8 [Oryzias melastigma]|uniref:Caspase-8 n=1 Tax=Oryzias melastigma TaxID=30732 RepID=A0A3B3BXY4_ORYME|nr:caspase-8 [Oryzias melastigma]XP_024129568.1 caspase-8 [Oryzias melastigma]XP_024129569.1 caspase-8 [Oryzias melastigma]XP_024129570.1 caspase-8 [Oryzias melastigma]XP_024129571.1 caspase-8 [Oryzias melastigma]XP_024129572.1 caspase-8 [Oryzias melastigma]XP_036072429.1 caspase-8 [Oryzias melastigma]
MDRLTLSRIDDELNSEEVAELCFLCTDFIPRKRLEGISSAKDLFIKLQDASLLESAYLIQLFKTIHREDLVNRLQRNSRQLEEADAIPALSSYRVMLYRIHDDMTKENLDKLKFLLNDKLNRRPLEKSKTVLDVFLEMEKTQIMSKDNVSELHRLLLEFDKQLATVVEKYMQEHRGALSEISNYQERPSVTSLALLPLPQPESGLPSNENLFSRLISDAAPCEDTPTSPDEEDEYYSFTHNPRGLCVIFNNEDFPGTVLTKRSGTQEDEKSLNHLFHRFGFEVVVHNDLKANAIQSEIRKLGQRDFSLDDALVVCVLSHGDNGCVYGTDEQKVELRALTKPFTSDQARSLAGKPKLFFIQACQGKQDQSGSVPMGMETGETHFESDAATVPSNSIPSDADFLLGMATVPECKSFRHTKTGSIYIQELCRQLERAAESSQREDILSVLLRVNREVSKGVYLNKKQMPEPKYTLTKKVVLKYVSTDH